MPTTRQPDRRVEPSRRVEPALGLLEFDSIAAGIAAGDAMAKRAPIEVIRAGTVHPGRYLVLVGGAVADVEEALEAGREAASASIRDVVFLPNVHPGVVAGMRGARRTAAGSRPRARRSASSRRTPWRRPSALLTLASRARGCGSSSCVWRTTWAARAISSSVAPWRRWRRLWRSVAGSIAAAPGLTLARHRPAPRGDGGESRHGRPIRGSAAGVGRMQLARVTGTVVATIKTPGLTGRQAADRAAAGPSAPAGGRPSGGRGRRPHGGSGRTRLHRGGAGGGPGHAGHLRAHRPRHPGHRGRRHRAGRGERCARRDGRSRSVAQAKRP